MTLVLGIDSSTQSTKALVIHAETGTVVAEGRAPHPDGTEVHPGAWWHACQSAIALACAGLNEPIAALSVAGQQHGLVTLDSSSHVVRPALLWNDTRSAPQARRLVDQLGASWWATQTGSVPVASFTITKLAWLAEHEPANADRVATVLLPHDWLTWQLSGRPDRFVTDRGDASGTGYFAPHTNTWLPDVLSTALAGRQPALPDILAPATRAGQLHERPAPQPAAQPGDSALGQAPRPTQQSPISAFGEGALGPTARATQPLAGECTLGPAIRPTQPLAGESALGPVSRGTPSPGDSALGSAPPAGEVPRGGDALSAAVEAGGVGFGSVGGALAGAVVGPGTGDNMAAALGLSLRAGDVVVSLGTSGTVFAVAGGPVADPTGAVAGFCDATGAFLPLVCTLNAARVLSAAAGLLGVDLDGLDSLALQAKPGSWGLVMLPYLEGERTPNLPDATGTLSGLRGGNMTPENLARAAVEGMLCGLADGLAALRAVGVQVRRVLLIGGASRSAAVQAVAAGLFGAPVEIPEPGEYVALGAARQAAWVLSGAEEPPAWHRPSRTLEPNDDGGPVLAAYAEARRSVYR